MSTIKALFNGAKTCRKLSVKEVICEHRRLFSGDALLLWGMKDFSTADGTGDGNAGDTFSGNAPAHLVARPVTFETGPLALIG